MLTGSECSEPVGCIRYVGVAAAAACQLIFAVSLTPHGTLRPLPLKLSQLT